MSIYTTGIENWHLNCISLLVISFSLIYISTHAWTIFLFKPKHVKRARLTITHRLNLKLLLSSERFLEEPMIVKLVKKFSSFFFFFKFTSFAIVKCIHSYWKSIFHLRADLSRYFNSFSQITLIFGSLIREWRNNCQGLVNIYWTETVLKFELQKSVKYYV
jgi:hypothetical protein